MSDLEIRNNEARASELLDREWFMLVGGELVEGISGRSIETRNPATGALLGFVPFAEADDVEKAVAVADEAFKSWKKTSVMERVRYVHEMITVIRDNTSDLGLLDAIDNGSPVTAMTRDVQLACEVMGYYTSTATEVKGVTVPATAQHLHLTLREPFGVVGRIVPYNHPLLFVATKIIPPIYGKHGNHEGSRAGTDLIALPGAAHQRRLPAWGGQYRRRRRSSNWRRDRASPEGQADRLYRKRGDGDAHSAVCRRSLGEEGEP